MPWTLTKIHSDGARAEKSAAVYLRRQGLRLLEKNFACPYGELDLIMLDLNTIVFIEVRLRSTAAFGSAAESITYSKIKKIKMTANIFLQHNLRYRHKDCRFDAVTISCDGSKKQNHIEWTKGAF